MSGTPVQSFVPLSVSSADLERADMYALLAHLFYGPPSSQLLRMVAAVQTPAAAQGSAFAEAWRAFAGAAAKADPQQARQEYEALFYGPGRAQVMLYGSYYLAGFMMERPLGELREDLARLGLGRQGSVPEPEDHIAALCDVMRLLILGVGDRPPAGLGVQKEFFARHIKPWYPRLTQSLTGTQGAQFYSLAGRLMQAFFDLEAQSLEMMDHDIEEEGRI